jgi:hypothetical protein
MFRSASDSPVPLVPDSAPSVWLYPYIDSVCRVLMSAPASCLVIQYPEVQCSNVDVRWITM